MNSLEALTRLIEHAAVAVRDIERLKQDPNFEVSLETWENIEALGTAASICQAVLNTALPIARFRMHVSMPESMPDFTISSPSVKALIEVLQLIREKKKNQLITASLWEQYATGAEMLHGFEGNTRSDGFKHWIHQVKASEHGSQVQAVPPEGPAVPRSEATEVEDAAGATEAGEEAGS